MNTLLKQHFDKRHKRSNVVTGKGIGALDIFQERDGESIINFDRLIPSPKTAADCPEEYILPVSRETRKGFTIEPETEKAWFNWYD